MKSRNSKLRFIGSPNWNKDGLPLGPVHASMDIYIYIYIYLSFFSFFSVCPCKEKKQKKHKTSRSSSAPPARESRDVLSAAACEQKAAGQAAKTWVGGQHAGFDID